MTGIGAPALPIVARVCAKLTLAATSDVPTANTFATSVRRFTTLLFICFYRSAGW
jgi:hypothetical protein